MASKLGPMGSPGAIQTFAILMVDRLRTSENVINPVNVTSDHASIEINSAVVNVAEVIDGDITIPPGKGVVFQIETVAISQSTAEIHFVYTTDLGHIDRVTACLDILPWIPCTDMS